MKKNGRQDETAFKAAKKYVDEQLKTMRRFGSAPDLSKRDYDKLIRKVVAAAQ